jgi:hypothetical protein
MVNKMLFISFMVLLSTTLSATVFEGREILLESGKSFFFPSIDSENLSYVESHLGCSTNCASACLTFSRGQATLQCTKHCGCAVLISPFFQKHAKLVQGDVTINIVYPMSDDQETEIFVRDAEGTTRISVDDTSEPGYFGVDVAVNNNHGDPSSNEAEVSAAVTSDGTTTTVEAEYESVTGEQARVYGEHYQNSTNNYADRTSDTTESIYAETYTQDKNGNNQTNYYYRSEQVHSDGENVTYYKNQGGEVAGTGFAEEEVGQGKEDVAGTGSGTSNSTVVWWVNSQGVNAANRGMGWGSIVIVLCVLAVIGVVAYRKFTVRKVKRERFTDSASESELRYIRI